MEENYRNLCQVFTPTENVKQLLDWCGYTDNLYGKKIIENSCGDGSILKEVVRRYIEDCLKTGISKPEIEKGLSNDIYAIEYDEPQYKKCIKNQCKRLIQRAKTGSLYQSFFLSRSVPPIFQNTAQTAPFHMHIPP